jgi:hypothetical protein
MNKVSIGEIKTYLGLDGEEQNKLLAVLLDSAEHLCEKVLRAKITEDTPKIVKTAILFVIWQLYFHSDEKEFASATLERTVAVMLSDIRLDKF